MGYIYDETQREVWPDQVSTGIRPTFMEGAAASWEAGRVTDVIQARYVARSRAEDERLKALQAIPGNEGRSLDEIVGFSSELGTSTMSSPSEAATKAREEAIEAYRNSLPQEQRDTIIASSGLESRSHEIAREANRYDEELAARRGGFAGMASSFAGRGGAVMFTDPLNLATLPLGPMSGARIMTVMAVTAAIEAGVEAVSSPFVQQWRKEAGMDYGWEQAATNIASAAILGGGIAGVLTGMGKGIARMRGDVQAFDEVVTNPTGPQRAARNQVAAEADELAANPILGEGRPDVRAALKEVKHKKLKEPVSMLEWLRGKRIQEDRGDIAAIIGGPKGQPGLISKDALPADDLLVDAKAAGYMPDDATLVQFKDAIDDEFKGGPKRYSTLDEGAAYDFQLQERVRDEAAEIESIVAGLEDSVNSKLNDNLGEEFMVPPDQYRKVAQKIAAGADEDEIVLDIEAVMERRAAEVHNEKINDQILNGPDDYEPDPVDLSTIKERADAESDLVYQKFQEEVQARVDAGEDVKLIDFEGNEMKGSDFLESAKKRNLSDEELLGCLASAGTKVV